MDKLREYSMTEKFMVINCAETDTEIENRRVYNSLLKHGAGLITREVYELKKLGKNTSWKMTTDGILHPKHDTDKLYVRKE